MPYNSIVAPDANCGRVFYLVPSNSTWSLEAFDIAQGVQVGSVPIPALTSAPQRLVRWGADGLALYNTNSQVIITHGLLVPTNQPVDVALMQSLNKTTATTNDVISFSLQATNLGPGTAKGVLATQNFSLALTNVIVTTSMGSASYTNGTAVWRIGDLPTNTPASLTISGQATQTGTLTVSSFASHALNDPFWGNNTALGVVNILNANNTNVLAIQLAARELVYDPSRDIIYASTPASSGLAGNLIAEIDPATGALKGCMAAGSEPDQISLSDDNGYLAVALDGAMGAQRFNLASNSAGESFTFSTNDICFAQDLLVQPGHPGTVVVSLGSYNFASSYPSSVVAYDNGLPRTNTGGPSRGLTFSSDGSTVYGYVSPNLGTAIECMSLGTQGFTTHTTGGFTTGPGNLKYGNGRIYSAAGQVAEPNTGVLIGSVGASGPQAIDIQHGRAFYLAQSGTNWQISAFDISTLLSTGTQIVPGVQGTPASLINCGQDRLAFVTSAGQMFIVHSPLAVTNALMAANLGVSQVAVQDFTAPSKTLRFYIAVTNAGPGPATNVLLAIIPPASVSSLTLQIPQGSSTNAGGNYLCNLGNIPAGQSLFITLSAVVTNTLAYSNYASVSAATPDTDFSNNTSTTSLQATSNPPPPILDIQNVTIRSQGIPALQMLLQPGYSYTVYASTNLTQWTVVSNFNAIVKTNVIADPSGIGSPTRFYRIGIP